MKLIDTHCHLNDQQLYQDVDNVISRALQTGIEKMVVIGWDKESSELAIKLAEQYPFIYATVGFHPENLEGVSDELLYEVLELSKHPKVVGIGEIGLDYHWEKDPAKREIQKEFFIKQIEYANKVGLPISIHSREAFQDTLEILQNHKPLHSGVMHCYSGSVENIKDIRRCRPRPQRIQGSAAGCPQFPPAHGCSFRFRPQTWSFPGSRHYTRRRSWPSQHPGRKRFPG